MVKNLTTSEHYGQTQKVGFVRVAAAAHGRESWALIAIRLATRALAGLEEPATNINKNNATEVAQYSAKSRIRESLFDYIKSDFRSRMDVAITWLTEEWYNDRVVAKFTQSPANNYEGLMLRLLDYFLLYVNAKDKVLIQFLSEVPSISAEAIGRVKKLAKDTEMVSFTIRTLLYAISTCLVWF